MSASRIVVDTNVILSRVIRPESTSARAFERSLDRSVLLASDETLIELRNVLMRPKFDHYLASRQRLLFLHDFSRAVTLVPVKKRVLECRDVRDNKFLEVALNGDADLILTGDQDLLVLAPWRGISIVTPAEYLEQMG